MVQSCGPKYPPELRFCHATGAVGPAHNVLACAGYELRHPADTGDEEATVNEKKNDGRVPARLGPVDGKRELQVREKLILNKIGFRETNSFVRN